MWAQAIEDALIVVANNIKRFENQFPLTSTQGNRIYRLTPGNDWTEGFWTGMLWLSYEYSKDDRYRDAAIKTVDSFRERLMNRVNLDHHDIGFLYSLSTKAQWILEQDDTSRLNTLQAADILLERWREIPGMLQAWGPKDDPQNGGRIIIDCLMNLPLLHWAYQQTGEERYRQAAEQQTALSRRFLVRGDDSSYHTFYFDLETGDSIRGGTHQGSRDGSTWTRGQAWGIYGFALAYRYMQQPELMETSKRLARYFVDRLPDDGVVYWDFDVPQVPETKRDSSAAAIAASGMLELASLLPEEDNDREWLTSAARRIAASLVANYSTAGETDAQGLINRGSYAVRLDISPDDYVIWGDYFYLEALMRMERGVPGYWYERQGR
ncbi:unsaturated chondroitin disaccharide hydrolase [Paenibacillus catalpae]|uniref:Unsaturated chondroitin disaccharide hydrolase n=1 Tax=Paenibacillus catalpae TaxID=1045775 RepID=A0A1I1T2J6_9BACL|nr:glycoside hydrolase family 88 protein [Paenibacillus catalpae]SFD52862.1 unsaturated chondroitin disaccharide hydrolase [Paenibacillus catalpae]